jgi:hypothetical protein
VTQQPTRLPDDFEAALSSLRSASVRPEVTLEEIPAPKRQAPYAIALSADATTAHGEEATGRFILLHDPAGRGVWHGRFRIVTYLRAIVDTPMAADPLMAQVAWTWLTEALDVHHAQHHHAGGTATRVLSENFGALADGEAEPTNHVEVRASWTPDGIDLTAHLQAWADMVASFAGLPPVLDGVIPLPLQRHR